MCNCPHCNTYLEWEASQEEVREAIWDKGMPHESREIVRPGDANWSMGTPIRR